MLWWTALGLVWAVAVYLRAEALFAVFLLGFVVALSRVGLDAKADATGGTYWAVFIMFACIFPWGARCDRLLPGGSFHLTTLEGISLYEAVYPGADGGPKQDAITVPEEMRKMNEAQRNEEWMKRGWMNVFNDPGRIMRLAVRKIGRTWTPLLNAGEYQNPLIQVAMGLWHVPLFILAIVGVFGRAIRTKMKWLLLTPILYFTAVHALFLGSVRYRVPLMPIVCIFAASGIVVLWRRIGKRPGEVAV